ncbi:amino acid ABC transporter ATP-binding/permease protein [Actinomyces naeslundii]|uniref:amino acid ABC transporter ATP-binding/permease protein n=1 Tax=Actinomyces naeslundii TaxID=1655 RepID=UPI000C77A9ED|nr:ABC transporter ATP-binding protein [Actinomyces naeslundii]PKY95372.1 ABC transporter ATP-binding protein [Actinomyces naeslundii]
MTASKRSSGSRPHEDGGSDRRSTTGRASSSTQRRPSRATLVRWLLQVTRPVLSPLLGSTLCRITDMLSGVALFSLGAYAVAQTGLAMATGAPAPAIWPILAVMAGLSLLKAALRYAEQFLGHLVAFKALELLRGQIFRSLIPRSPRVSATSRSGDLLSRATKDVDRIEVFFAHTFAPAVSAAITPIVVLTVISLKVSWPVALAALPFAVLQLLIVPRLGFTASLDASRSASATRADLTQHVTDTVQGMSEVVGYGRSQERLDEMARIDAEIAGAARPTGQWASVRRGINQLASLTAPIVVIMLGAMLPATNSGAGIPLLAAAAAAVLRMTETVRGVEELAGALNASFASAERVWEVVNAPVEVHDGDQELTGGISHEVLWQDVTYSYPSTAAQAVRGVSVRARAGKWTCIVGASGSGKSTLAQLAVRFDEPDSGRILIDGQDVAALSAISLYQEIGMVDQRVHLMRATIADNVRLAAPSASDAQVVRACRAACIDEDIEALEDGYDTLVGERGQSLSGGQRQRLALARALLARPGVLILDEFTSHLDPDLDERVRIGVRTYLPQATIIEITHRLQWSEQADHVVVMDAGTVVQAGPPAKLLAEPGPLRTLTARGR